MPTGSDVIAVLEQAATDRPALTVDANLGLTVDGTELAVSSSADRIHVQIPSITKAASLFSSERGRVPVLSRAMAQTGVTAEIRIGDAVVAVLGAAAVPSSLSERLWGEAVEIRPGQALAAALRLQ